MTSKAVPAQKAPYKIELEEGKNYAWCACGLSSTQPFCDGAHKEVDMKPIVFTAGKSGDHYLCGCKASGNGPMCDGTHNKL